MIDLSKIEYTKVSVNLDEAPVLIYGEPKLGKSTFATKFPNPLFFATEPGHRYLSVKKWDVYDWDTALELGASLATQNHNFKTIIIDTVDGFYNSCEEWCIKKYNIKNPSKNIEALSDLEYGKAYNIVKKEFHRVILKFISMKLGVAFISHAKPREVVKQSSKWTQMAPSMSNTAQKVVLPICDQIFYFYRSEDGERMMQTKPTKYIIAGDRSGKLPEKMPMDYGLTLDYISGKKISNSELSPDAREYADIEAKEKFKTKESVKQINTN